jgi:hypothetical protein
MNNSQSLGVKVVAPQSLKKNTTTHSMYVVPENYEDILNNIREFGLLTPLLVSFDYEIISGNLRHQIALDLKMEEVPVVFINAPEEMKAVMAVSSNQFRKKSMVQIASEIRFFDEYYSIRRGERTDLNPQMKVVRDEKASAYKAIGKYTVDKLKSIEKKVKELHGDNINKINNELSKIDKELITQETTQIILAFSSDKPILELDLKVRIQKIKPTPFNMVIGIEDWELFNQYFTTLFDIRTGTETFGKLKTMDYYELEKIQDVIQ